VMTTTQQEGLKVHRVGRLGGNSERSNYGGLAAHDLARDRGGGPRLVRLENTDLEHVVLRTEDRLLHQSARRSIHGTKGEGKL
jgi:hypothetical protein